MSHPVEPVVRRGGRGCLGFAAIATAVTVLTGMAFLWSMEGVQGVIVEISGRVIDRESGAHVAGARVYRSGTDRGGARADGANREQRPAADGALGMTDEAGRFAVRDAVIYSTRAGCWRRGPPEGLGARTLLVVAEGYEPALARPQEATWSCVYDDQQRWRVSVEYFPVALKRLE